MFYNSKETVFQNAPEILAIEANLVAFTTQISNVGVVANANGRKIVAKGSLLDSNGTVKNDGTVVGILLEPIDVTEGPQPGALIVEGFILKDRLPVAPSQTAIAALKNITFR